MWKYKERQGVKKEWDAGQHALLLEAARGQPGMKSLQVEEQKWKWNFPPLSAAVHTRVYKNKI